MYFASAFAFLEIREITPAIIAQAIALARTCRLKAADAIIAATALESGSTLLTQDQHFWRIPHLRVVNPLENLG